LDSAAHTIPEAFRRQARIHASSIAVSHGTSQLTYRELEHAAEDLATRLHRIGVRPGEAVAISLDRSIDFIIAQLGILFAGAICVPLDPQLPESVEPSCSTISEPGSSSEIPAAQHVLRRP